jgi:hypothetical protein
MSKIIIAISIILGIIFIGVVMYTTNAAGTKDLYTCKTHNYTNTWIPDGPKNASLTYCMTKKEICQDGICYYMTQHGIVPNSH